MLFLVDSRPKDFLLARKNYLDDEQMEAEVKEVDESCLSSTLDTPHLKTYSRPSKKGLSTKLEILQDFGVSDIEINDEEVNNEEDETDISKKENMINKDKNVKGVQPVDNSELPVKLPPDITVLKEVVETPTPAPLKRKRGRPKRIPLDCYPVPGKASVSPPTPSPSSDGTFPCSICPRTFNSNFGRKIHETSCKRRKGKIQEAKEEGEDGKKEEQNEEEEKVKESPVKDQEEQLPPKRKRGRARKCPLSESPPEPQYVCETCDKVFNTLAACRRHEATCKRTLGRNSQDPDGYIPNVPIYNKQLNINQPAEITITGEEVPLEAVDVKDPYVFEEGRCHCCGEDIETAHMGGEFECTDCKKLFRLKSSLERHRRVVHNEGDSYQCPECDARCPDKGTLARHMYTHTGLKPVSCPVCKTEFSRKYHLIRHNFQTGCDGSKRPSFPCQVCGRVFNRKDNLREHLRAHAGQTKRKKRYTCEECNQEFLGTTLLNLHKRTHMVGILEGQNIQSPAMTQGTIPPFTGDKPFGCEFCPKRFPSKGALIKHRRKHTGERPYECTFCFARFAAKETLNRHLRTHTGVKPHTCQYCGKGFIQASQLRAHVFHHSGEGGFDCEQCGKSFNRRQRLMLHIKYVHEGAEPFKCSGCTRTFLRKEDLSRHQLLHSGVKEHKCPICEKTFAMKSSLKIHLLTHTKEPPRSCDECGRAFIRQDCLLRHMRTKHRDMLEEIMADAEKKKLQTQLLAAANQAALQLPSEEPNVLSEATLAESVKELLTLLVDETTLKAFGWPDSSVDKLLEAVIRRCGHQPAGFPDMAYPDRLRENAKLLFTVVIDDSAVKTLLNNQTVDEVILHVLRLAKS